MAVDGRRRGGGQRGGEQDVVALAEPLLTVGTPGGPVPLADQTPAPGPLADRDVPAGTWLELRAVPAGQPHIAVRGGEPGRHSAQAEPGRVPGARAHRVVPGGDEQPGGGVQGVPGRLVRAYALDRTARGDGDPQLVRLHQAYGRPAGQDGQPDGRVRHRGREDPVLGEAEPVLDGHPRRYDAPAGLDADQAAAGGRDAYRAEAVVAVRDRDQAGRDRRRGAAGRAAGGPIGTPRVAGDRGLVVRGPPEPELGHPAGGHHDGTGAAESAYHLVVLLRD